VLMEMGWVGAGNRGAQYIMKASLDFHGADLSNRDQQVVILPLIETNHQLFVAEPRHRCRSIREP
jgi:hypothetical protein